MSNHSPIPRPKTEEQVDFVRQEMVRWFSPGELVSAGLRVVLSGIFGAYADKRELEGSLEKQPPLDYSQRKEIWIDYVSDLGDGFDSTFTVASAIAASKLELYTGDGEAVATQRGDVLIMGGDEVYPTPSIEEYENRTLGPYRAALPGTQSTTPDLYAIPGNHDWYDGLTSFMRVFCQHHRVGAWQTNQTRSYFALRLPHRWWLWAIDIQLATYIDEPQLNYFLEIAESSLQAGDAVILCSAKPSWVEANKDRPEAYVTLDYFERKVIRPRGASLRLSLTGDAHHYAHYRETEGARHKITAGGGGAYLSATHRLPRKLILPPPDSRDLRKTDPPSDYELVAAWPDKGSSTALRKGVFRLPFRNPSFVLLAGGLATLYGWTVAADLRGASDALGESVGNLSYGEVATALGDSPVAVLLTLLLGLGFAGFTQERRSRPKRWVAGLLHLGAQVLAIAMTIWAAGALTSDLDGFWLVAAFYSSVAVLGGVLGSFVMAAYLYFADGAGLNTNELFSAQRIEDYKNFLRLHIDDHGKLHVSSIGIEHPCRRWRFKAHAGAEDPWFEPEKSIVPKLIEEIEIERSGRIE